MSELLDLLPPGSRTDADRMLIIGDCRADDLANEFGTPVLVVAEEALRARAREYVAELTSRWPNARVVFASKAFPARQYSASWSRRDLAWMWPAAVRSLPLSRLGQSCADRASMSTGSSETTAKATSVPTLAESTHTSVGMSMSG